MNKMSNFFIRLKTLGIKKIFIHYYVVIANRYYEHKFRISTSQHMSLSELSLNNPLYVAYWGSEYLTIFKVLKWLSIRKSDVFIDYGSGMGRVIIAAATLPFKRVIGVEISDVLNTIARENINNAMSKLKCQNIKIVQSDVSNYQLPDDVTVCFLFNPFRGNILKQVFANIRESLNNSPRSLKILYYNPPEKWLIEANCNWVSKIKEFTSYSGFKFHVYTNIELSQMVCNEKHINSTE